MQTIQGKLKNTKPLYASFRSCVKQDLCMSDRLRESGLGQLLIDVVQFCFAGEECRAPLAARKWLAQLIHPDHSICGSIVKGKTIVNISEWPSWLNKGHKKHIAVFNELFYSNQQIELPVEDCQICQQKFRKSFWFHILFECS